MFIESLKIERFGIFGPAGIGPLSSGLNLLAGPNEAGKTTILNLVLSILFGFPDARARGNDYKLQPEDRLGGRLTVRAKGYEQSLVIARRGGKTGGTVEVRLSDGSEAGEAFLTDLLAHLDRSLYRNLYAFSLYELSDFGSLNSEALQARIYSAGTGTGAVAVPELMKSLEDERGGLFKPGGKKPRINELLDKLQALEQELSELGDQAAGYDSLIAGREGKTIRLAELEKKETELNRELERTRAALKAWESWEIYKRAGVELADLDPVPPDFPARGADRLAELRKQIEKKNEDIAGCQKQIDSARSSFVANLEYEKLLSKEPHLVELERGFEQFLGAVRDLPGCLADQRELETKLQREIKELNPTWSEKALLGFDSSIQAKQRLRKLHQRLEQADKEFLLAGEYKEETPEPVTPEKDKSQMLQALPIAALILAGGWLIAGNNQTAGIILAALGVAALITWWLGRKKKLSVTRLEFEKKAKVAGERREKYHEARAGLRKAQTDFESFKAELGLAAEFSPETVSEVFTLVQQARFTLDALAKQKERVAAINACIEQYTCKAGETFAGLGEPPPGEPELAGTVRLLLGRRDKARQYEKEKKLAEQKIANYTEQLEKLKAELEELLDQKKALVSVSAVSGDDPRAEERFLVQAALAEKRAGLSESQRQARTSLIVAAGAEDKLEELFALLRENSAESLAEGVTRLGEERETVREETKNLNRDLGEIDNELQKLSTETRASELRLERSQTVEELSALAEQWAVLTLALETLRKATARFERERQPDVLREGQVFLGRMTGGKYCGIHAPLGERRFEVVAPDSGPLPPEKLSRGTAEQLYLALRFGLVRELGRHRETLPIMLDDILVNFDPERCRASCEAVAEMARSHQVLYFTCHPHIVELFRSTDSRVRVIDLETVLT